MKDLSYTGFDLVSFLKNVSTYPGIYRMYDDKKNVIYVGKAKNLRKRLNSYYDKSAKDIKTKKLVNHVVFIDITVTPSDYEAYLLEITLIKRYKPRYNILFKDGKCYPYIVLSNHAFPRLYEEYKKYEKQGTYFGPYSSSRSMRQSLTILQKIFSVRCCNDSYFYQRKIPCLQYQINRCSAPCVNKISREDYGKKVDLLKAFMEGKVNWVIDRIAQDMYRCSESQLYEEALRLKNQLTLLTKLRQQQIVDHNLVGIIHVITVLKSHHKAIIVLLEIIKGKIQADQHWLITINPEETECSITQAFLAYHYLGDDKRSVWPEEIILPDDYDFDTLLCKSIEKKSGSNIKWTNKVLKLKRKWQNFAEQNAKEKISAVLGNFTSSFSKIQKWLMIKNLEHIECFDISHLQGEGTVASCVLYTEKGPKKPCYRHYNISNITPGDDYSAIKQVIERRMKIAISQNKIPDLVIIDGGKGHIGVVENVITKLGLKDQVHFLFLSKGPKRISGQETIYYGLEGKKVCLSEHDDRFLLLRQIRDSSHEFALKFQRKKIRKRRTESFLQNIPGIGLKRSQALLTHFGGYQLLSSASVDEIAKVKGISVNLAGNIWQALR